MDYYFLYNHKYLENITCREKLTYYPDQLLPSRWLPKESSYGITYRKYRFLCQLNIHPESMMYFHEFNVEDYKKYVKDFSNIIKEHPVFFSENELELWNCNFIIDPTTLYFAQ